MRIHVGASIVTLATVISAPRFCQAFQPTILPLHSTSTKSTAFLERRTQQNCFQLQLKIDDDDNRIGFFHCNDASVNNLDFKSFADRISRDAKQFAAMSILFFSIGTSLMGPALPAFADVPDAPQQQEPQSVLLKEVSTEELEMRIRPQESGQFASSAIDEVWTLLDKYYIDHSFTSQDW